MAQLFLNHVSVPSPLDLKTGIFCAVRYGLSENRCEMLEIWDVSRKSMQAGRHEDGKNVSSKKLQFKTNPDNPKDNILKFKAGIIWSVVQFQISLLFSLT